MKYEVQISRLAVVCVICTSAVSAAFGASSVRSLGGAGTYSSASAAASASANASGASGAARAGSMRVTPTANKSGSSTAVKPAGTTTNGRVATSPRLSIGKYLGGGTSVSGGSSIKNQKPGGISVSGGGTIDPGVMADLNSRVGELEGRVDGMYDKRDVDAALSDKQNVLVSADDYVVIENDEIFLDVNRLQENLEVTTGGEIEIGSNETHLLWRYKGGEWQELIALEELRGPQGPEGPQGPAGEKGADGVVDTTLFPTIDAMDAAIKSAVAGLVTTVALAEAVEGVEAKIPSVPKKVSELENDSGYLTQVSLAGLATQEELKAKANAADVYTKAQADDAFATKDALGSKANAADVYTKDEVNDKVAEIAAGNMAEALKSYAKTDYVNTELGKKANAGDVTALAGRVDGIDTDVADAVKDASDALVAANAAQTAANNAATAAGEAGALANAAKSMADTAKSTADTAKSAADTALAGLGNKANAADVYTKTQADDVFATKDALNLKADAADLGALATKDKISDADVADNAAIAGTKLATDVQASLAKADQALIAPEVPNNTGNFILAVSGGQKGWFEVIGE